MVVFTRAVGRAFSVSASFAQQFHEGTVGKDLHWEAVVLVPSLTLTLTLTPKLKDFL